MIKLIVDSTYDFTKEEADALGIDIVALKTQLDGIEYKDRTQLKCEEFYDLLAESDDFPKTSQPSPEDFINAYKPYVENKDEIIVFCVSSKLSGTCQSALLAKDIIEYENMHVVDALTGSHAGRLIVEKAIDEINKGKSFEEVVAIIEEYKGRTRLYAVVDTLEYLQKGGRVSMTSAFVGSLLKFKPILKVIDGKLEAIDKKRGMKKAIDAMIEQIKTEDIDFNEPARIAYSGNNVDMSDFKNDLLDNFAFKSIESGQIGPVIGSHAGPGAKLVAFVVKK